MSAYDIYIYIRMHMHVVHAHMCETVYAGVDACISVRHSYPHPTHPIDADDDVNERVGLVSWA